MLKQFGVVSLAAVLLAGCRDVDGPLTPASSEPQQSASSSPSSGSNLFQQRYERSAGEPITVTANVTIPAHVKEATLRLVNGTPDGKHRVSAATVTFDGSPVIRPSDLSQDTAFKLVPLRVSGGTSQISVKLEGKPGAFFTLSLENGQPVGAQGGELALDGGAVTVEVPAGAVSENVVIAVEPTPPSTSASLAGTAYDFGPDGQKFAEPITVTLPGPAQTPSWTSPDKLTLVWDSLGQWVPLRNAKRNSDGTLSGDIDHFTVIGVGTTEVRVCKDDPEGIHELADGLAAVANGGRVVLCDGDYAAARILVRKPVTVENETGAAPRVVASDSFPIVVDSVPSGTVVFRGLSFAGHRWAGLWIGAIYDDVRVENSSFVNGAGTHAVYATNTEVTGGRVTLRNIQVSGGATGVFAHNAPRFDVLDSRFSGQTWSGIQVQVNTSGTISGNTVTDCGRYGCIRVRLAGQVSVLDNVIRTGSRSAELPAGQEGPEGVQFGIVADGTDVRVERNLVEGVGTISDPSQASSYAIRDVGILALSNPNAPTQVVVNGNTVRNAARGIYATILGTQKAVSVQGQDNQVSAVQVGTGSRGGAKIILHRNDFTGYYLPFSVLQPPAGTQPLAAGDLTCNWWGRAEGPSGAPETVASNVYTPFAGQAIAGQPAVSCDPTPAPLPSLVRVCPDGSSAAVPSFRTVAGGVVQVASGGTVQLCGMTHTARGVELGKPLTLEAEPGTAPVVDGADSISFAVWNVPSGTVTFRGLSFQNHRPHAINAVRTYDQVVIESSVFVSPSHAQASIFAGASSVPGSRVTVRDVEAGGGAIGVFAAGSGQSSAQQPWVDVVDSRISGVSHAGLQWQGLANGSARNNTIEECGRWGCVRVRGAGEVSVIGNTIRTTKRAHLFQTSGWGDGVLMAIVADGVGVTVEGNTVEGLGTYAAADPGSYPIGDGIVVAAFQRPTHATVRGNTVRHAARGLVVVNESAGSGTALQPATAVARDNVLSGLFTGALNRRGATSDLKRNDFTSYVEPMRVMDAPEGSTGFKDGDLTCNWWGSTGGPQNASTAVSAAVYTPFADAPIAGTGRTCP